MQHCIVANVRPRTVVGGCYCSSLSHKYCRSQWIFYLLKGLFNVISLCWMSLIIKLFIHYHWITLVFYFQILVFKSYWKLLAKPKPIRWPGVPAETWLVEGELEVVSWGGVWHTQAQQSIILFCSSSLSQLHKKRVLDNIKSRCCVYVFLQILGKM